jgi:hypothetical protein
MLHMLHLYPHFIFELLDKQKSQYFVKPACKLNLYFSCNFLSHYSAVCFTNRTTNPTPIHVLCSSKCSNASYRENASSLPTIIGDYQQILIPDYLIINQYEPSETLQ